MDQAWRDHLVDEGDGTMRIRAHGTMKVDARLVTDAAHMQRHADDRGPEQLVNTASLPGVVGEAWAMADWHYGYGFPIGGVVATDTEFGDAGGAISPGGVGFDINCGVRFLALDATAKDIPNLKKLAGRLAGRIPAGGSGKGVLTSHPPTCRISCSEEPTRRQTSATAITQTLRFWNPTACSKLRRLNSHNEPWNVE